jgi:hypothetical protein
MNEEPCSRLSEADWTAVERWNAGLERDRCFQLLASDHQQSAKLEAFATTFAQIATRVRWQRTDGDAGELPAIVLEPNIRYHAVPGGNELLPFLDALAAGKSDDSVGASGEETSSPTHLRIYVTCSCPFCPSVVRGLLQLAAKNRRVALSVVDAALFAELAAADAVRSVPTTLLEGGGRWIGSVDAEIVREAVAALEAGALPRGLVERMLRDGDASAAADLLLERRWIPDWFIGLLAAEAISVRMGAMVAMERIVERDPKLAFSTRDAMFAQLEQTSGPAGGDLLYLIGEIADATSIPRLESYVQSCDSDELREAADEARLRIAERLGTGT